MAQRGRGIGRSESPSLPVRSFGFSTLAVARWQCGEAGLPQAGWAQARAAFYGLSPVTMKPRFAEKNISDSAASSKATHQAATSLAVI